MNQIINTNRAVRVKFDAYTSTTQITQSSNASIYVPFPVREILIKGIDLDFGSDFKTMFFTSSLVDGNYVGSGFAGGLTDYSSSTKQLRYIFNTPRDINGSYSFTYSLLDNVSISAYTDYATGVGVPTTGSPTGYVLFVIEFIGSTTLHA